MEVEQILTRQISIIFLCASLQISDVQSSSFQISDFEESFVDWEILRLKIESRSTEGWDKKEEYETHFRSIMLTRNVQNT